MRSQPILLSLLIVAVLFFWGCSGSNDGHPEEFVINGSVKNSKGEMLRLNLLTIDSVCPIDSVEIDEEGQFSFRGKIDQAGFYTLGTGINNFITLVLEKGEDVVLEGNLMELANDYKVNGSPGSMLLWELNDHTRRNIDRSDSLFQILEKSKDLKRYDSVKQAVDSSYALLVNDQRAYIRSFITKNSGSLASLHALYQNFGREPMVNEQEDFDLYELLEKDLAAKYPNSPYVVELKERVAVVHHERSLALAREQKLDSGNIAPEILLKTPVGTNVSLSSFKGHVVLLHFWAGWSAVSQQDMEFYKFLKKKYEGRGLVLFGVSLDKDRQTWEDAVRENKITWTQVSDLMEWGSPVVKDYNITSIPVCFLIGSNGKIVSKRPNKQQLSDHLYRIYKF